MNQRVGLCKPLGNAPFQFSSFVRSPLLPGTEPLPSAEPSHRECSPLLNLPLDIVYVIGDHLENHDKWFLAKTCRSMRTIFWQNWEDTVEAMGDGAVNFWTGVSHLSPDHYVSRCGKHLRRVDIQKNIPSLPMGSWFDRRQCVRYEHHHVQLALKYARGCGSEPWHMCHLGLILLPFEHEVHSATGWLALHRCRPIIAQQRFLLHEQHTISPDSGHRFITPGRFEDYFMVLCPHLRLPGDVLRDLRGQGLQRLKTKVALAFFHIGKEIHHHCDACPTDFSFRVAADHRNIVVSIWRDFGPPSSPCDSLWRSHQRIRVPSPPVSHEPGSVRLTYLDNVPTSEPTYFRYWHAMLHRKWELKRMVRLLDVD